MVFTSVKGMLFCQALFYDNLKYHNSIYCMSRARFPSEDVEPAVLQSAKKEKSGRLSSLSKLKSAIRM